MQDKEENILPCGIRYRRKRKYEEVITHQPNNLSKY